MSLAGIAIAIGVLVDAGIVVTENAFRFMEQRAVDPPGTAGWSGRPFGTSPDWSAGLCSSRWQSSSWRSSRCSRSPVRRASSFTR